MRFYRRFDPVLILLPILVLCFGVLVIYGTSPALARQQAFFAILGLGIYFLLALVDYRFWRKAAPPSFFAVCVLLLLVFLQGHFVRGVTRWLVFGPWRAQPSEIAKMGLILILAFYLARRESPLLSLRGVLFSLLLTLPPTALIFLQPDVGTAFLLLAIWLGMVVVGGIRPFYLFSLMLFWCFLMPVVWLFLKAYQRARILTFLNPLLDPLGSGYNVIQAMIAVGAGRIFGRGLGRGTQSQLRFLPERHTDFIFACLAEEWGLLGAIVLLTLFVLLLWRILWVGRRAKDRFGLLLSFGVFSLLLSQIGINVGMNLGLAPVTGVPLPLVSYGGSSLVITLALLGLVQSVAAVSKMR